MELRQLPAPAAALSVAPAADVAAELIELRSSVVRLQATLVDQGEREADRLRVLQHAHDQERVLRPAGLRGLVARLVGR